MNGGVARRAVGVVAVVATVASGLHAAAPSAADQRAVVDRYCVNCHNDRLKTGGLSLAGVDLASVGKSAEVLEKVVRKLRVGAMPPAGAPRPEAATLHALTAALETDLDRAAAAARIQGGPRRFIG